MKPHAFCRLFLTASLLCGSFLLGPWASAQSSASQELEASKLVKQGQKLNSEGKQDEAIVLYQQALQIMPDSAEAQVAIGVALDLQGKYDEAREHLNKAIVLASPDAQPQVLRTMAVSYAFEGKPRQAEKFEKQVFDARIAKQDYSGAGEIANEMGRIALEVGDLDLAYEWYQVGYKTALRKPSLEETYKNLWEFRWAHAQARIAARRGQKDEAEKQVAAAKAALAKAKNPDQERFLPYLTGYVAFYASDYKSAIADFQKADQHDPFIVVMLGLAYEKSGDKDKALDCFRKVMTFNNHNPGNAFARPLARQKLAAGS